MQGQYVRETLGVYEGWMSALALDPMERLLASAASDKMIRIWDLASGQERLCLQVGSTLARCLLFARDGRLLICGTGDPPPAEALIIGWEIETGKQVFRFKVGEAWIANLMLQPGGSSLLVASHDGTIQTLDLQTGRIVAPPLQEEGAIYAATLSADGRYVACAGNTRTITIWDQITQRVTRWSHPYGKTYALAFHPKQGMLASGHSHAGIALWDWRTATLLQQFEPMPYEDVFGLAFVRGGDLLIGASGDHHEKRGSVCIWPVSGSPARMRLTHDTDGPMYDVVATVDGALIASGGHEDSINVWRRQTDRE